MNSTLIIANVFLALIIHLGSAPSLANDTATPQKIISGGTTKLLFGPNGTKKVEEYIQARHLLLDELSLTQPGQILDAQFSFRKHFSAKELISLIQNYKSKKYNIFPYALNIGWEDQSAEYRLQDGESLPVALDRAHFRHGAFVRELYESALNQYQQQVALGATGSEFQQYSDFLAHASALKRMYETRGVLYYGLQARSSASQLKAIKDSDPNIRLIDPMLIVNESPLSAAARKLAISIAPNQ